MQSNKVKINKMIKYFITASRREDFLSSPERLRWLVESLDRGECQVPNPHGGLPYTVKMTREDVWAMIFWTKNPLPGMGWLDKLEMFNIPMIFFLTLNNYPDPWEKGFPPITARLSAARELQEHYGKDSVWLRYDPLILTECHLTRQWHENNVEYLLDNWNGLPRCVMSMVLTGGGYRFIQQRIDRELSGDALVTDVQRYAELAGGLGEIASWYGVDVEICAQPALAMAAGLPEVACLDYNVLKRVVDNLPPIRCLPTRKHCSCIQSRDVGQYNVCGNQCLYCYAKR